MEVHNIVADGSLYKELDRDGLIEVIEERTEYHVSKEKTTKSAVILDMGEEYDNVVIYKTGSYAIKSGTKDSLFNTHAEFVDLMIELGVLEIDPEFDTNNIVATHQSRFNSVNLPKLAIAYPEVCEYEPEQYPAVIYKPEDKPYTVNIYSNGKFSICAEGFDELDESVPHTEALINEVYEEPDTEGINLDDVSFDIDDIKRLKEESNLDFD